MLQLVKGLILTIALGLSATESIVSARTALQDTEHEPALKTVLVVTFAFSAADGSDDVTEDMLNSICAHVKKHAAFEANIDLEDGLECQHSVYGLPVQVNVSRSTEQFGFRPLCLCGTACGYNKPFSHVRHMCKNVSVLWFVITLHMKFVLYCGPSGQRCR